MGTNFYWRDPAVGPNDLQPAENHLGKRSSAGYWCWACGVPLCAGGVGKTHTIGSCLQACPQCGTRRREESFSEGSVGVEFGFAAPRRERPTGITSFASFSWAQDPGKVRRRIQQRPEIEIQDEYGSVMTGQEFLEMLNANCPVELTDSVGKDFR